MEAVVKGPDRSLWHGRRVFVTGHTGFKGGWLSLWLARLGADVRGYALPPATTPNLMHAARVAEVMRDVHGDINHAEPLAACMKAFAPEVVFHLAAQPLVRLSYTDPLLTYRTNVMGTANVLDAVRQTGGVRAVVVVTTDKCYENREWDWPYRESDALGGYDPYSSSKACAELVTAAFRQSYFHPDAYADHGCGVATARAGNVIGGGDWSEDRLLPDLMRGFLRGEAVRIRRPGAVRPWQHVLDPLYGYLRLAEELLQGKTHAAAAWNFAPSAEDAWPVDRIADTMTALWGEGARWVTDTDTGAHEAGTLKLDASRARAKLGWQPALPLTVALEWLVGWYRAAAAGKDMHAFTMEQIAAYESLLKAG